MIDFPAIKIKQATPQDAATILPLFAQFFAEDGYDISLDKLPTAIAAMLNDPGSAIFVAWCGVDAIAVATVTTTSQGLEFNGYAELEDLYVLPEARRVGVGGILINQVKQWCRQRECNVLSIVVTEAAQANRNLIAYYQKHGFQPSKRSPLFCHLGVEPRFES
jgi:aminoglycoside 6'-N-acetyltransferase I